MIPCYVALRHPSQSLSVLKAFFLPLFTIIANQNEEKGQSTCQKKAHNVFMNIRCCLLSSKNSDDEVFILKPFSLIFAVLSQFISTLASVSLRWHKL